jgi:Ca2+-transporting ATPase
LLSWARSRFPSQIEDFTENVFRTQSRDSLAGVLLDAAAACCDAELHDDGSAVGDPTEVALLQAARAGGVERAAIEHGRPRVAVHPFDSVRKRMSVRRSDGVLYVKGAVDLLLPLCTSGADGAAQANERLAAAGAPA